jgi:hypothetical protein
MDLFNKTFFRFAFGFLGIILFSVAVIIFANEFMHKGQMASICLTDCQAAE